MSTFSMKTLFFTFSFATLSASAHFFGREVKNPSNAYIPFCASSKPKRSTTEQIAYKGNTGTEEDYGCNIMVVDQMIASQYEYTARFNNAVNEDQACVCFNKIGPDGQIDGFWSGNEAISFTLPASGTKIVAFDANSQGGCVCSIGEIPTANGQFAGTWLEFDFGNESNDNWSGADASCLVAAAYGLETPALKVCSSGVCSSINTNGTGENAYVKGTDGLDGVGLNLPPGRVHLTVAVGE
ncbi:allergen Asp F4-like protein [Dactylonectria macrodidyma]|uniref:Allergen Asp F4-like protein n=1 Tax=Dactylonectria macrodidyma TaxID=307937 RepID=A0A9P9DIC4_9HYPO|nr:allergen Asp F4-like protein [Dactylonectria macrodidyma]